MTQWKVYIKNKTSQFIHFVNGLNRRQLAFLSTFFSLGFFILILANLHLYPQYFSAQKPKEIYLAVETIPEPIAEEKPQSEVLKKVSEFKSNQAFNTANKATYNNIKAATLSGLEAQNGNEEMAGGGGFSDRLKALEAENQKILDSLKAQKSDQTNLPSRTRVYFHLFEREKVNLPIPVYTCRQGGKVVVNIKVSPEGVVVGTEINTAKSNTTNGCLLDNALNYAAKSHFNSRAGKMQWGTITYYFQAKRYR